MPKKVMTKEGTLEVTATLKKASEIIKTKQKSDKITVRPFATEPAYVSIKKGVTKNLGDFESARVDILLTMPCYVEEMLEVFNGLNEAVEELISDELEKLGE